MFSLEPQSVTSSCLSALTLAHDFEARQASGYVATADELEGTDRGLRAAAEGRLASDEQVEAVFGKRGRAISRYSSLYNSTGLYRNPKD